MNEFSSQPTRSVWLKSDTERDIEFNIDALLNIRSSDSEHDSVVSKHRSDVRKSERAPLFKRMTDPTSSDQALISTKILPQLGAIVIESKSVYKSCFKVKSLRV